MMYNDIPNTCDRCGADVSYLKEFRRPSTPMYFPAEHDESVEHGHIYLCDKCRRRMADLLKMYFIAWDANTEKYVAMPGPDDGSDVLRMSCNFWHVTANEYIDEIEDLHDTMEGLMDENNLLKSDIEKLKRRVKALRVENTDLSIDIEELDEELERLRDVKEDI